MPQQIKVCVLSKDQQLFQKFYTNQLACYAIKQPKQGKDLKDNGVQKIANESHNNIASKFMIKDSTYKIVWLNGKIIENINKKQDQSICIFLLSYGRKINQDLLNKLKQMSICKNCFLVIIDQFIKCSNQDSLKYQKQIYQKLQANLSIPVDENSIISIDMSKRSQDNSKIICQILDKISKNIQQELKQKQKSQPNIIQIKPKTNPNENDFAIEKQANKMIQKQVNNETLLKQALINIFKQCQMQQNHHQKCYELILKLDQNNSKKKIKSQMRSKFLQLCQSCLLYQNYKQNKISKQNPNTLQNDLMNILKKYVVQPKNCLQTLLKNNSIQQILQDQVYSEDHEKFISQINQCQSYQQHLKNNKKLTYSQSQIINPKIQINQRPANSIEKKQKNEKQYSFIFHDKIWKICVNKEMQPKSLINFVVNYMKEKRIQVKEIDLLANFQNSKSIKIIDQSLEHLEILNNSQIKNIRIQAKVDIIVLYETQKLKFTLKSDQSIYDLKKCIQDQIKISIESQCLQYQRQREEEIKSGTFNQIKENCFYFIFTLQSNMNLQYYGFHSNYQLKFSEFSKFYVNQKNDIDDMINSCTFKEEDEPHFFNQLVRHLYSALKRNFKFSLATDEIKLKIIEKKNQQIWSKQNFTNFFILYFILYNSEQKLRIELMNILRTHFALPLYFRNFNNINEVKNQWNLNNQILWLIHEGIVVTSIGLHSKDLSKENGKTHLNNKLFYTEFQGKEQKHPISFGCPQITLKSLGNVVPINIIDIPSDCSEQIRDKIILKSNVLIIHSWLNEKDTKQFIEKMPEKCKKYIITILRDSNNSEQTLTKIQKIKFQQKQILPIHNLQQYENNNKEISFLQILRTKVWQIIDLAHQDKTENKKLLYGLFDEPVFNNFDKVCQKIKENFYNLGQYAHQIQKFKSFQFFEDHEQYQKEKKKVIENGLHPDFREAIVFMNNHQQNLDTLMLRFREILKEKKHEEEKKFFKIYYYKSKIEKEKTNHDDFQSIMKQAVTEINKLPFLSKITQKLRPNEFIQELSNKIQEFQIQIKPRFFTIELAWRQLQHLALLNPQAALNGQLLMDILINFKRKQIQCHQPFEFLDGDLLEMPKNILKKSFEGYKEKVVVVTILGPQSCGKSTQLNFLFGCDFKTSEGRQTKGVYGTFFRFANPRSLGCDGIILVDTEGLFANLNKKDAQKRKNFDSKLVLFCLAISDIVIINTKGNLESQSTKILKSSWDRFSALTQENMDWPQLFLVLNQNNSGNTITSGGDINQLQNLLKIQATPFSLNQAYNLIEISKKDVLILPAYESYVKKEPRKEFLNLTNQLQQKIIEKIEKKNNYRSIKIIIDNMQKMWSTIQAFPDLGRNVSKRLQQIENEIKEWKLVEIEKLNKEKDKIIMKFRQVSLDNCQIEFQRLIQESLKQFSKKFIQQKFFECSEQQKKKIQLQKDNVQLSFKAIKYEIKYKKQDFDRIELIQTCYIQRSEFLKEITQINKIQIQLKKAMPQNQKFQRFNLTFNKFLEEIKLISSLDQILDHYYSQIFQYYENALKTNNSNLKLGRTSDILGLPQCKWERNINSTFQDYSKYIKSCVQNKSSNQSNKILEYRKSPPTVALDQNKKTDAKLQYFNMRDYFGKAKIKFYYRITQQNFIKSLKKQKIKQQMQKLIISKNLHQQQLNKIFIIINQYLKSYGWKIKKFQQFNYMFHFQINKLKSLKKMPKFKLLRIQTNQNLENYEKDKEIFIFLKNKQFHERFIQNKWQMDLSKSFSKYASICMIDCINWQGIKFHIETCHGYIQNIKKINEKYTNLLNKDMQHLGLKIQYYNFYKHFFEQKSQKLKFIQINTRQYQKQTNLYQNLQKLKYFNHQNIIQNICTFHPPTKSFNQQMKPFTLEDNFVLFGSSGGDELRVKQKFKNNQFLKTYISGNNKAIYCNLKTDTLKTFIFLQLLQKKSFDRLFQNINQKIKKYATSLTRNNIKSIFVDVCNQIKQFNNDLNQVSHKMTLMFTGFIHLYAVHLAWKQFSNQAIKEANKPCSTFYGKKMEYWNIFLLQTSNETVQKCNGQCEILFQSIKNFLKKRISQEKKKINQEQSIHFKKKNSRKNIQEMIDKEKFVSSNKNGLISYLQNPGQFIENKYVSQTIKSLLEISQKYKKIAMAKILGEQIKGILQILQNKLKMANITYETTHFQIFNIVQKGDKQIIITDLNVKVNVIVMNFFLDLMLNNQMNQYEGGPDFNLRLKANYMNVNCPQKRSEDLQQMISTIRPLKKMSITQFSYFVDILEEKFSETKFDNLIRQMLDQTQQDINEFKELVKVKICQQLCPGCQRICGVQEIHTNKHQCLYGHQMRALGNVKLTNGDASVIQCEDVKMLTQIQFNGRVMTWKQFKQYWEKKEEGSWCFDDLKNNKERQKFIDVWDAVGKIVCESFKMKFVKSNNIFTKSNSINMKQSRIQSIHYIFAIDQSGSMKGQKWTDLMQSLNTNLDELVEKQKKFPIKLSIIPFGTVARVHCQNQLPSRVNRQISFSCSGDTIFAQAFEKAYQLITEYISQSTIRFIFMSDGISALPTVQIQKIKKLKKTQKNKLEYYGIQFHKQTSIMKQICKSLNGQNKFCKNQQELTKKYREIINRE